MKIRSAVVLGITLFIGAVTFAQDDHKIEATGDYFYFRLNPGLPSVWNSQNLNGGDGQGALYFKPWLALAADLQGYVGSIPYAILLLAASTELGIQSILSKNCTTQIASWGKESTSQSRKEHKMRLRSVIGAAVIACMFCGGITSALARQKGRHRDS
jgi:hypothetical protein